MSDEKPEKDDKNSEESERTEGTPDDNRPKKPNSEEGSDAAPQDEENKEKDDCSKPSNEAEDFDEQEKFDEIFDEETDPDLSDYYYDEIEDDDMYDYGLVGPDLPKRPKSAAGRMLSRQRKADDKELAADNEEEEGMSFLEHLEEFRWTVGRIVVAFILGLVIVTIFIQDIAELLKYPILRAYGSVELVEQNLITYRPMGVISVFFQVALLGGFTLSMPFMLYFLGAFVAPGLTEKERRVLRPSCMAAFFLFVVGVMFAFLIILPLTLAFSVRLNQFFGFELFWAASDYYNMVVWFSLATGAFFQFPLLIVILVYLQVLPVAKLKSIRKGVFVGLMVFSALMSPGGDFVSLPITTAFMYGLYELAIWVGGRIERKKRENEEA